jgi:repressor LexA
MLMKKVRIFMDSQCLLTILPEAGKIASSRKGIMDQQISRRQKEVLDWVAAYLRRASGIAPTVQEIATGFGIDPAAAHRHLKALQRKGFLTRSRGARSIALQRKAFLAHGGIEESLPIVGEIAAGIPILAEQNIEGHVLLDRQLLPRCRIDFLLRVRGDSMVEAGVSDRDLLMVRKQEDAESGSIVVAMIGGEDATVKRLRKRGGGWWLEAANGRLTDWPRRLEQEDRIVGLVVGLFRRF